jgi:hypothetical protein
LGCVLRAKKPKGDKDTVVCCTVGRCRTPAALLYGARSGASMREKKKVVMIFMVYEMCSCVENAPLTSTTDQICSKIKFKKVNINTEYSETSI